ITKSSLRIDERRIYLHARGTAVECQEWHPLSSAYSRASVLLGNFTGSTFLIRALLPKITQDSPAESGGSAGHGAIWRLGLFLCACAITSMGPGQIPLARTPCGSPVPVPAGRTGASCARSFWSSIWTSSWPPLCQKCLRLPRQKENAGA